MLTHAPNTVAHAWKPPSGKEDEDSGFSSTCRALIVEGSFSDPLPTLAGGFGVSRGESALRISGIADKRQNVFPPLCQLLTVTSVYFSIHETSFVVLCWSPSIDRDNLNIQKLVWDGIERAMVSESRTSPNSIRGNLDYTSMKAVNRKPSFSFRRASLHQPQSFLA